MTVHWASAPTDLGVLTVARTGRGCVLVRLDDTAAAAADRLRTRTTRAHPGADLVRDDDTLSDLLDAARSRIAGDPNAPAVALDLVGTPFQRSVWDALCAVPFGEVRTYGEIASAVGAPRAVRAVGSACGANPVALIVPCHRVVPAAGGTGNYGLGVERKRVLLEREGVRLSRSPAAGPTTATG